MNKAHSEIDVHKVVKSVNENLKAIRDGFDPEQLSEEGLERISKQLEELKEMALKIKADLAKD